MHESGIGVYFKQQNMCFNEQKIQMLLTAYRALAKAESKDQ